MKFLSDVQISGISTFLADAKHYQKIQLFNTHNAGVGLVSSSKRDGCLDISYGSTAKTGLWGGDIEVNLDAATNVRSTSGFFRLGACAGIPSGVPRTFGHGTPMVYDTSHDRLYAYNHGWKPVGGGTKTVNFKNHYLPQFDANGNLVSSIIMEAGGHGWVFVNGHLLPGQHASGHTVEGLGTAGNVWDMLHVKDAYLYNLKGAKSLAVDSKTGKVIVGTSGPGSGAGNVSTSTGKAGFTAVFTGAQTIGPSQIYDTTQDLAVISRNLRQSSTHPDFTLGTVAVPWKHVFTKHLRVTTTGVNAPSLATNRNGDVVRGTANLASSGGTPSVLAMFTSSHTLGNAPVVSTGSDVVINKHNLRQDSSGGRTLGTTAIPWDNVITKTVRLKSVPANTKILATDSNGDIVVGRSSGSGLSGGIPSRIAIWKTPTTIGNASMSETSQDFVFNDGKHIRQASTHGSSNCGTFTIPWNYVVTKYLRFVGSTTVPNNTKYLGTNQYGTVVASPAPGTPTLPSTLVYSNNGGHPTRLAMFTTARNIVDAPVAITTTDVSFNGRNLRQWSKGGQTLGTDLTPWDHAYTKTGIRIANLKNKPYLRTNRNGDIEAASAPGGSIGREYLMANWKSPSDNGVLIKHDGKYYAFPTLSVLHKTPGTGHLNYDGRANKVLIPQPGLYAVHLTPFVQNLGSASSGALADMAFELRLTTITSPITKYKITAKLHSGQNFESLSIPLTFTLDVPVGSATTASPAYFTAWLALDSSNGQNAGLFTVLLSAYRVA